MYRSLFLALILTFSVISCGQRAISVVAPEIPVVTIPDSSDVGRPTLDEMCAVIGRAYAANPDSNRSRVQQHIWMELRNMKHEDQQVGPLSVESSSIYNLNWQEILLLAQYPEYAWATKTSRDDAVSETNRQWPSYTSQYQNKPDAFRHAYWNILMSRRACVEWAYSYSTAHESGATNGLLDSQMDLNNNALGRSIWRYHTWSRTEASYSDLVKRWQYTKVTSFTGNVGYLIYLTGS
jgi:hypothetical protein